MRGSERIENDDEPWRESAGTYMVLVWKGKKWRRRREEGKRYYNSGRSSPILNDKCLTRCGLWEVHTNKWLPFARGEGHNWERRGQRVKKDRGKKESERGLNTRAMSSDDSICIEEMLTFLPPLMISQVCSKNKITFNPKDIRNPVVMRSKSLCLVP